MITESNAIPVKDLMRRKRWKWYVNGNVSKWESDKGSISLRVGEIKDEANIMSEAVCNR